MKKFDIDHRKLLKVNEHDRNLVKYDVTYTRPIDWLIKSETKRYVQLLREHLTDTRDDQNRDTEDWINHIIDQTPIFRE